MAYGAAAGGVVKLIQQLIRRSGVQGGTRLAKKLGFPDSKINQAVKKLRGGTASNPGAQRQFDEMMRSRGSANPQALPRPPMEQMGQMGRAQLGRRAPMPQRPPIQRGMAAPRTSRKFSELAAMAPMRPAAMRAGVRPKVPQAYKRALKGTPLMKMLNRVNPENRAQALKLLMQMGVLGAGGTMALKMMKSQGEGRMA